ncbi:MAG: 5-(carboxyamino)imidazole ribonucleotide mutase [Myxococcales bacterium]|nr:MAG: 5-(carboxyamino)imidazole ribonucleotide mutase [Myxococcales bacterium]
MAAEPRQVWILMGSDSDAEIMKEAYDALGGFGVPCRMVVTSAHRSPARTAQIVKSAAKANVGCFIVGAGAAAHLAGVVAAHTALPVIGVPIDSSALQGLDALLATVQMPGGVPVACMAIGKAGAQNAGLFAVQLLALSDAGLARRYQDYKDGLAKKVAEKDARLQKKLKMG